MLPGVAGITLLIAAVVVVSYLRGRDTPPAPSLPKEAATPTGELQGGLQPAAGSFVGYRVNETLIGIGLNTAVGRTSAVKGVATVAGGRIVAARFEIETGTLRSDEARRDETMRFRGLETDRYPKAGFVLAAPATLAPRFTAHGRLTLHGRTRPVKVRLQSRRDGDGVDLAGSTPIEFSDYGMQPPSVAGVASVRDHGQMEVRLRLR
jgi:polyisoprenoid-binding protein YceI